MRFFLLTFSAINISCRDIVLSVLRKSLILSSLILKDPAGENLSVIS